MTGVLVVDMQQLEVGWQMCYLQVVVIDWLVVQNLGLHGSQHCYGIKLSPAPTHTLGYPTSPQPMADKMICRLLVVSGICRQQTCIAVKAGLYRWALHRFSYAC